MIYLLNGDILNEMADTIRQKNGKSALMTPAEMAEAILTLPLNTNIDDPYKEFLSFGGLTDYIEQNCELLQTTDFRRPSENYLSDKDKDKHSLVRFDITRVGAHAFDYYTYKLNLHFPNATLLGASAFESSGLEGGVLFPGSMFAGQDLNNYYNTSYWPRVSMMGPRAFYDTNIHYINMPKISTITSEAFRNCFSLETAVFESHDTVRIEDNAFYACSKLYFVQCCPEYIGDYAFYLTKVNRTSFTYLTHDTQSGIWSTRYGLDFIKHIGAHAFDMADMDGKIELPSLEYIGDEAFGKYATGISLVLSGPTIPDVGKDIFSVGANDNAVGWNDNWIYVPDSLVDEYKNGKWSDYKLLIKPLSLLQEAQSDD